MKSFYLEKQVFDRKNAIRNARITLFYKPTCAVCPRAVKVLDGLTEFYPHLQIIKRVVEIPYLGKIENFTTDFFAIQSLKQFGNLEVPTIIIENEVGQVVGKITGADYPPIDLELWIRQKLAAVMNLMVTGSIRIDFLPPLAVNNFRRMQELHRLKSERVLKRIILQTLAKENTDSKKCIPIKELSKKCMLPETLVFRLMLRLFGEKLVYIDKKNYCYITDKGLHTVGILG